MIQVLTGEKGSGKTKKLISIANELVSESNGSVIYISNSSESMFDLSSAIRLIDTSQFPVSTIESFEGFISGILSQDYDIETIFIDNLNGILGDDKDILLRFFAFTKKMSESYEVRFIIGLGAKERIEDIEAEYIAV